jgi:beta-xylosidase/AraC-like DNA-binding protein
MENDYVRPEAIVELEFLTNVPADFHAHENIELFYLLAGEVALRIEDDPYTLCPQDMVVINAGRRHRLTAAGNILAARFVVSYAKLCGLLEQPFVLLWCNSAAGKRNDGYAAAREIISKIFGVYFEGGASGKLALNGLYYQLLDTLVTNFTAKRSEPRSADAGAADTRMNDMMLYLRQNYYRDITLGELSERYYVSTAHLSKYIKKRCGVNFVDLLCQIRVERAVKDLTFNDTSVMKVAMDNGFANVAAMNKAFRERFGVTPSEYRRKHAAMREDTNNEAELAEIRGRVSDYLRKQGLARGARSAENVSLNMTETGRRFSGRLHSLINAGTATDITKSAFQKQLLLLKERIGVVYVRFWDIYAPEMYLDIHSGKSRINFGRFDEVTDFLTSNGLKPYIDIGFKPLRLLKTTRSAIWDIHREQEFESLDEMKDFFEELIHHIVKRYGEEEVLGWYFEFWKKDDVRYNNRTFTYRPITSEEHALYVRRFGVIATAFRNRLPGVKIGGGGFAVHHYGREGIADILRLWNESGCLPSFISLNSYPYQLQEEDGAYFEKKSDDALFVKHDIELVRSCMEDAGLKDVELHVSEYNVTLSNRNAINDNCAKAAFLVHNALACTGMADLMGYWHMSDNYADFHDTQSVLFGGCGLLTKSGIQKPAFYAFEFLNGLYHRVVAEGRHYAATRNERGSVRIVCHNYKAPSKLYYATEEDKIDISDIQYMTENDDELEMRVTLNDIENGTYTIQTSAVNRHYGSVQDEWLRLNAETDLTGREQNFLERVSTPRLFSETVNITSGVLEHAIRLCANEIRYIHIWRRKSD